MPDRLPPPLADWLEYLAEIGYREARSRTGEPAAPELSTESATRGHSEARSRPVPASHFHAEPVDSGAAPPFKEPAQELLELAARAEICTACPLAAGRNRVVFGSGPSNASLMFIGEGPGAEEDRQGLPFVGRAGELLTRIVAAIELNRNDVYIANIVKCRPPANREPEVHEIAACRGFLERQIDLVRPLVIVCLGRVAAQSMLGSDLPISKMRGNWFTVRGVETMVTYHPAALLRNPALKRPTWDDMQKVRDRLRQRS